MNKFVRVSHFCGFSNFMCHVFVCACSGHRVLSDTTVCTNHGHTTKLAPHWNTLFLVYIAFHCLLFWGAAKKCVCASIRNHHNPVDLVKCIEFQYINYVLCQVNANWILRVKKEQSRNINAYHTWLCEERKSEFFV